MRVKGRKITMMGVLRLVEDVGEVVIPMWSKQEAWRRSRGYVKIPSLEDYFPSEVERVVGRLARRGWVEKVETKDGVKVILTGEGKKQVLMFKLGELRSKKEEWDGKWRVVFFDVEEKKKGKRRILRRYLGKLGFWQMQKSVWVCPYDCDNEIKYLREVLEVPSEVKIGVMERIENEEDLKKIFKL